MPRTTSAPASSGTMTVTRAPRAAAGSRWRPGIPAIRAPGPPSAAVVSRGPAPLLQTLVDGPALVGRPEADVAAPRWRERDDAVGGAHDPLPWRAAAVL